MNIHLETEYRTHPQFYPVYSPEGRLLCTELRVNFCHPQSNVAIPQAMLTPQLDISQRILLLQSQINLIESAARFFSKNNIKVSISVDGLLADTLLESDFLLKKMSLLAGLQLDIAESFPGLHEGADNPRLRALSDHFSLALSHYGAGNLSSRAVFDSLFERITLDRALMQRMMKRASFSALAGVIVEQITPYCGLLVLAGADDLSDLQKIRHLPLGGIESALFPPVPAECLDQLLTPPPWLGSQER